MRRTTVAVATIALLTAGVPTALAEDTTIALADPPGALENVDYFNNVEDTDGVVALEFLSYGEGRRALDVMVVSGTFGVRTYDLTSPTDPVLMDSIEAAEFRLPGDPEEYSRAFWENEDMNVDHERKLVFMARDPRAFDGSTSDPSDVAGVYFVDASDPHDLVFAAPFHELPVGHTSTCINDCDYLWTGGPASNTEQQAEWPKGRPIFATDIRDMENITTSSAAIDLERDDGVTAYAHDVDVDQAGIAWVSGRGGVRGYHTKGTHRDPLTGQRRLATPVDPIPYAGGETDNSDTPSTFLHNSDRPTRRNNIPGAERYGYRDTQLVLATEEAFGSNTCDGIGVFVIASLRGSYDGEGWRSTEEDPFRLETVGTWSPAGEVGTDDGAAFCSAHYFERKKELVAYSWYAQGTRFLDISNPAEPIQIAYFRPDDAVSFAPYFHDDYVYVADIARGVDILELTDGARQAQRDRAPVEAPARSAAAIGSSQRIATRFQFDPAAGSICLLPVGTS